MGGKAAGLGGAVSGISFTAQLDLAEDIASTLQDAVMIMQGPNTLDAFMDWAGQFGITEEDMVKERTGGWGTYGIFESEEQEAYMQEHYPERLKSWSTRDNVRPAGMFDMFQWTLFLIEEKGIRINPLFFGADPELFMTLDPANIGIVEAIIDTTDPDIEYLKSMEEWRVPIKSILSHGPVGSQGK